MERKGRPNGVNRRESGNEFQKLLDPSSLRLLKVTPSSASNPLDLCINSPLCYPFQHYFSDPLQQPPL